MKSMTGYGYAVHSSADSQLEVEIKSYNNRYLEVSTFINPVLSSYENSITEAVRKHARRGKVEVSVRLRIFRSSSEVIVDQGLLEQYMKCFDTVRKETGLSLTPDASALLGIEGLFSVRCADDASAYKEALDECLEKALSDFDASRTREGEETKKDLIRLGRSFEKANDEIGSLISSSEEYFRNLLLERYRELEIHNYDESKMMQEIGFLLVKYSINEEQNRLRTHIKEYFRLLESDECVGKKLDFLCQEMNREVNTTASKSQNVEITLHTVQMKDDLENIREQIRNIE